VNSEKPEVIALVGSTCTGKTALSIRLAQELGAEIIACDSRTIYKYMDIGTAKPTLEERAGVPHHLFDVVDPDGSYTVAQYKTAGQLAIADITRRGLVPIVCGGTGLYARALLEGLEIPEVEPQPELRAEFIRFADEHGNEKLHERLKQLDQVTAQRLNPNDRVRVVRALEVSTVAGKPFSQLIAKRDPPYRVLWIGLSVGDRDYLKSLIERRMQAQLDAGLVDEVRALYHQYGCTRALMNAVNYRELIDHFTGVLTFEQAIEQCIRHNYQLSRRQRMWFKTNEAINWITVDTISGDQLFHSAQKLL
jgi:tRNA dimethylallyltransferase